MSKHNPKMFELNGERINFQHDDLTAALMPDGITSKELNFILVRFIMAVTDGKKFGLDTDASLAMLCEMYNAKPSSVIQTVIAWNHGTNQPQGAKDEG